jgi:hypothetical protein
MSKKSFSQFTLDEALESVGLENLIPWQPGAGEKAPSAYFTENLRRLEAFDLLRSEGAKTLLVDAFFEEAIQPYVRLKIFKEATLRGEIAAGIVDYLVAARRLVASPPLLCVVEAKKDNFEKGLAQCLVEMQACAESSSDAGAVYGIVTNGQGWQFYRRVSDGRVFETGLFTSANTEQLLGMLDWLFARCTEQLEEDKS